jgi:hypothetical protein
MECRWDIIGKEESITADPIAKYVVYVSHIHKRAVGHRVGCKSVAQMGGGARRTCTWIGPFDSREKVESAANAIGLPFHWCRNCVESSKTALAPAELVSRWPKRRIGP